jgi:predicted dehydrogenase
VGVGAWGKNYVKTIEECPGVRLAAVVQRDQGTPVLGSQCSVFADVDSMLSHEGLDGVIVASSASSHYSVTAKVLEKGLAVLVEKPLATDPETALDLQKTCKTHGAVAMVNHIDLTNPAWRAVRRKIPEIGFIQRLRGAWIGDGPLRVDAPGRWDYGAHAIAVVLDVMGEEPEAVSAKRIVKRGDEEIIEARLSWKGGTVATLQMGNAATKTQRHLIIEGDKGTLEYDDKKDSKARMNGKTLEYSDQSPLSCAVSEFVDAILRREPDDDGLDLGVRVVLLLARLDLAGGFSAIPAPL